MAIILELWIKKDVWAEVYFFLLKMQAKLLCQLFWLLFFLKVYKNMLQEHLT